MKDPGSSAPRAADGRFAAHETCEACRKPLRGEYWSDPDTLDAHGVGQYLCARVRCRKLREAMTVEDRIALYGRQA